MVKNADAEGFFNDGLTFLFKDAAGLKEVRPKHIHLEIQTETAEDGETCDVRFLLGRRSHGGGVEPPVT